MPPLDQQDVITSAEHHVEETESFDLASEATVTCPTCGVVLALQDAPQHEHLRSDRELVTVGAPADDGEDEGPARGGRRRLARAREGRR